MTIRVYSLALAFILAGCGSGGTAGNVTDAFDKGFRDSFRPKFVESCVNGAQATSGTTKDFSVVCGCIADKLIATKSVKELMAGPSQDETKRLATQCAQEHPLH